VYSDAEVLENKNIKAYVSLRKQTKTGEINYENVNYENVNYEND